MIRTRTNVVGRTAVGGLISMLAISLTACGALGGESESNSSDGTVTVWQYYGDEQMPTGKPLYDALEAYDAQNDDVKVKIRFIPFEDFNRTLQQGAAAGEGPDVALINAFDTQQMAEAGVIEDISDQVEEWGEQDAYYPTSWETTQVGGKTYGIPHVADDYALYYNKDVFEAAGVQPPKTWDEMESTAATLAKEVKYGLAVSGREGAEGATGILLRQLAAGGDLKTFGDGTGAAALESFKRMVDNGGLSKGFLTWLEDDAKTQFAGGSAAMMINSATYVNILRDEVPDLNWGVVPLPKDEVTKSFPVGGEPHHRRGQRRPGRCLGPHRPPAGAAGSGGVPPGPQQAACPRRRSQGGRGPYPQDLRRPARERLGARGRRRDALQRVADRDPGSPAGHHQRQQQPGRRRYGGAGQDRRRSRVVSSLARTTVRPGQRRPNLAPYLFLAPAVVFVVLTVVYPLIYNILQSFFDVGLREVVQGGATWVGLDNCQTSSGAPSSGTQSSSRWSTPSAR